MQRPVSSAGCLRRSMGGGEAGRVDMCVPNWVE